MLFFKNKVIISLGLMALLGCVFYFPNDWMGWLIFGGSFYFIDKLNLDNKVKSTLLLILLVHQSIALYYYFSYTGYVEGVDFTAFNLGAKTIAEGNLFSFGTDAALFTNTLALFYKINSSQLFGQEITVVFFMSSCFVLMRIIRYYKLDHYMITILLLYALMPASLLWTSVILRESFEITFLMLAFECLLYFKATKLSISTRLLYLGCAFALIFYMCLLHKGLFLCLPVFLIISVILPLRPDTDGKTLLGLINPKLMVQYVLLILLPLLLLSGLSISNTSNSLKSKKIHSVIYSSDNHSVVHMSKDLVQRSLSSGIYETLTAYRYGNAYKMTPTELATLLGANTNYDKVAVVPQNLVQFGYMSLREYAYYAFLPAVLVTGKWSFLNLILSFIYITRFIFFCSAIYFGVIQYRLKVSSPVILLILYFLVSYVFALGTISYGTAMRHNMMTDWILLLLGTPLLYKFFHNLFEKSVLRRTQFKMLQGHSD